MASSNSDEPESRSARVPRGKIEAAMEEVAEYRRDLVRAQQAGVGANERLLRGFHAAVVNYYLELRNYRDWDAIEEEWAAMRMWPAQRERGISGLYVERGLHFEVDETDEGVEVQLTEAGEEKLADDEWVRGVDAIESWMDRTRVVKVDRPGLGRGEAEQVEPAYMPPRILFAASFALDTIARELGVSIRKAEHTETTEIDRELVNEVNEWWKERVKG